uniref:Reverse transcriptase zinc-binding domain-containing protein n=1 Tax=Xenopus tropicalis TaxID=8364 RepID=A0A803K9C7_XENTR
MTWNRCKKKYKISGPHSLLTPILGNPEFSPGLLWNHKTTWAPINMTKIHNFMDPRNHKLYPYERLKEKYKWAKDKFMEYLQIQHFINSKLATTAINPLTPYEKILSSPFPYKGLISHLYKLMVTLPEDPFPKHSYMRYWEEALRIELSDHAWSKIWDNANRIVTCTQQKESVYKVMMRWYMTPDRLSKIYPNSLPHCWRGCTTRGTLSHILWQCPLVTSYWKEVGDLITSVLAIPLDIQPPHLLLGQPIARLKRPVQKLVNHITTAARLALTSKWKSHNIPNISEVITRVESNKRFEMMTASITNNVQLNDNIWSPWETYLASNPRENPEIHTSASNISNRN